MSKIFIIRGAHGSGKTTLIRSQHLEDQTVSVDSILRIIDPNRPYYHNGKIAYGCDSTNENIRTALDIARKIIERRMRSGDAIIFDWTNSKRKKINPILNLAHEYNYEVVFVNVQGEQSLEEVIERSHRANRPWTDAEVEKTWTDTRRFQVNRSESAMTVDEFCGQGKIQETELSQYSNVRVIGDIQGCYSTFVRSGADNINPREFTVFCGDLMDRGPEDEAGPMFDWIIDHINDTNRVFIKGNHDSYFKYYGSKVWEPYSLSTRKTIEEILRDSKYVHGSVENLRRYGRLIDAHLVDYFPFYYDGKHYFSSHGGVHPAMLEHHELDGYRSYDIGFTSGSTWWYGTGGSPMVHDYKIDIDKIVEDANTDVIQFHGHRNEHRHDPREFSKIFNLETRVDKGGFLSIARIDHKSDSVSIEQY